MAEIAVLFVLRQSLPFVVEGTLLLTRFRRNFNEIKNELECFQDLLKNADTKAAADERVKIWVKQLREECFRLEDVIDKYNMYVAQRVNVNNSRFISIPQNIFLKIPAWKTCKVASKINGIKVSLASIKNRISSFDFQPERTTAGLFGNVDIPAYFNEEVVGFESSRDELVSWLVGGTSERTLVAVVGMSGLGKTTLANHVFNDQDVKRRFDCRFYISASQSNTAKELLIDMINKFYVDSKENVPDGFQEMGEIELINHVKQYLEPKRYLMCFDDVLAKDFSDGIAYSMIENNKGSRIIVTTQMELAANNFTEHFPVVHFHNLNRLPHDKALELFCKKAFRGQCPTELEDVSDEIVEKCGGLPLAIVTIGGLLSTKDKNIVEWRKMSQNLSMELDGNTHFTKITMILSRSYDDLPWHLKLCMLYFGIYPEHHTINCKRLIGQWIAEGFVRYNEGTTLEEVAEGYLKELIQTSLVQVSSVGIDGKVKSCKVHNLLRRIITKKMKALSFCHIMYEDHEQVTVDVTRRFSIATFSNNVLRSNSNSGIRAIFVFDKNEFPEYFIGNISIKFKLIKILDFAHSLLNYVPENLGSLFYLKYLNLSHTKVTVLPRSIGNLVNLETLDLRQTEVHELPMEINKLTKLRLLPVYYKIKAGNYSTLTDTKGVKMQKGIGCLESLQKLYFLEADHAGIVVIQELKKLRQLRKLGIRRVRQEYGNALCAAIQEMNFLESLNVTVIAEEEILDLDFVSVPRNLRVVNLKARLTKFPDWIPKIECLVKLMLGYCKFEHDPLDSLKNLQNLSWLILWDDAFAGDSLNFEVGGFPKLKELDLTRLNTLSSVSIGIGALPALEYFSCHGNPQLKVLPSDLQNLGNLKYLGFADMPDELVDSIDPNKDGPCHQIINHIPLVQVREKVESRFHEYDWRRIPTCQKYKKDMEVRILYQIFMSILRNAFLLKSISEISRFIFSVLKLTRRYTLNSFNGQFTLAFFFCFLSFMAWIFSTNSRMVI
ncbi:unnamed protein product [Trifolium pratense]|uniref:Uncharacterized protein n=1 Tax=Trifolium pratense TaxID=57577 RepID=A0ACB0J2W1_TRIPR|nr:unnamed protein product [Trifolium pratense]